MKSNKEKAVELVNKANWTSEYDGAGGSEVFIQRLVVLEAIEIAAKPPDLSEMYNLTENPYSIHYNKDWCKGWNDCLRDLAEKGIISLTPEKL